MVSPFNAQVGLLRRCAEEALGGQAVQFAQAVGAGLGQGQQGLVAEQAAGYVDLLTRARTADGGWAGLLRQARELLTQKGVRP